MSDTAIHHSREYLRVVFIQLIVVIDRHGDCALSPRVHDLFYNSHSTVYGISEADNANACLSNYKNSSKGGATVRDLTHVVLLDPAKEHPQRNTTDAAGLRQNKSKASINKHRVFFSHLCGEKPGTIDMLADSRQRGGLTGGFCSQKLATVRRKQI